MRTLLILFICFIYPFSIHSDNDPIPCRFPQTENLTDFIPNYNQPWWNNVRIGKLVVMYVDFPDGRYINGSDTLQAFYDWQLEWVNNNGVLDAAGEMGLVLEQTNIPSGNKYVKASKYTWQDRWNMFFDSLGVYYGTVHPDYISNQDSAFGSFKQYWKEASNGKFEIIPYLTHPNEANYKMRTGILNNYEIVNGDTIISCFKLPRKKYGSNSTNSYFRNPDDTISLDDASNNMKNDVINIINNQTDFNLQEFRNAGGTFLIYFAGSHNKFKDLSNGEDSHFMAPIRLRDGLIDNPDSRIDGFGVTAHLYGEMKFHWGHTISGRCDIMNGNDVHDNNCPQLPNPFFRMREGWIQYSPDR